jgi:flagellin-specific chaperone FliS
MLTSREKKKNNIAEYILYMWQTEDLIRLHQCDIQQISESILSQYTTEDAQKAELTEWWENLAEMMKLENKEKSGHLQFLINTVNDINSLHIRLIRDPEHIPYQVRFQYVEPMIRELEDKLAMKAENDIDLMLVALYNYFILKLKGAEISEGTREAVQAFAGFLALLSQFYKKDQEGTLFPDELV